MALQHILEKASVGGDGQSILLADKTVYGEEGNPTRADMAWVLAVSRHDGLREETLPEGSVTFLHNPSGIEPPEYVSTDLFQATHVLVPLDEDGLYSITSLLLLSKGSLSDTAGYTVVGELVVDHFSGAIEKVIGASLGNDGFYSYAFAPASFEDAVKAGYPTMVYAVLQPSGFDCLLDRAFYSYTDSQQHPSCGGGTGCYTGSSAMERKRKHRRHLAEHVAGAKGAFRSGLHEHVLKNLRCAAEVAEIMKGEDC